jgi:hypothetical protein
VKRHSVLHYWKGNGMKTDEVQMQVDVTRYLSTFSEPHARLQYACRSENGPDVLLLGFHQMRWIYWPAQQLLGCLLREMVWLSNGSFFLLLNHSIWMDCVTCRTSYSVCPCVKRTSPETDGHPRLLFRSRIRGTCASSLCLHDMTFRPRNNIYIYSYRPYLT